jgi:hypothetical protein
MMAYWEGGTGMGAVLNDPPWKYPCVVHCTAIQLYRTLYVLVRNCWYDCTSSYVRLYFLRYELVPDAQKYSLARETRSSEPALAAAGIDR